MTVTNEFRDIESWRATEELLERHIFKIVFYYFGQLAGVGVGVLEGTHWSNTISKVNTTLSMLKMNGFVTVKHPSPVNPISGPAVTRLSTREIYKTISIKTTSIFYLIFRHINSCILIKMTYFCWVMLEGTLLQYVSYLVSVHIYASATNWHDESSHNQMEKGPRGVNGMDNAMAGEFACEAIQKLL